MPTKLEFTDSVFKNCEVIGREIDLLFKTEILISPYYSKETVTKK